MYPETLVFDNGCNYMIYTYVYTNTCIHTYTYAYAST